MTNLKTTGMKSISYVVAISTILWAVGLGAMVPAANAAVTLTAGDLIKSNVDTAVYLYNADGTRSPYPNGLVYKSWFTNFNAVKTMTLAELQAASTPSRFNVTYRPGTKLVKLQSDAKVYAVLPGGTFSLIGSEAVATALYGANWSTMVDTMGDTFFGNYVAGAAITTSVPPLGSLIKTAESSDIYYVDVAGKRLVSSAGFTANGFQTQFVRTVATSVANSVATATNGLTAREDAIAMFTPPTSTTPTPTPTPVTGSALSVALASDTPAATTLIADVTAGDGAQALAPVLKLNFTAGTDGDVKVSTLKLTRGGISTDTDLSNVYLYDGETRVAEYTSIANKVVTFTNAAGLFTVTKGTTKALTVKIDLANGTTSGKTVFLGLAASTDLVAGSGVVISGTFPQNGNVMSTATAADLGKLTINSFTTFPASVDPDGQSKELWRFNLVGADQPIEISKLMMTVVGTINPADIANLYLEYAGTAVTPKASIATDNTVTFDLSTPIKLDKGQTKTIVLKGEVVGGTNRSFKFTIRKSSDIAAKDTGYGVWLKPNQTDTLTIIEPTTGTGTSITTGTISITRATTSPTNNVALGATSQELARFKLVATGEAVKITALSVSTVSAGFTTAGLNDGKILFGSDDAAVGWIQLGSTTDLNSAATDDGNVTTGGDDTDFNPGNSLVVQSGEAAARYIKVVADIKKADSTALADGNTFTIKLNAGTSNATGQVSLVSLSTASATGNLLTVKAGALTPSKNLSVADGTSSTPNGVKGTNNMRIGSVVLTGGAGEAVTVTQIKVQDSLASATATATQPNWLEAVNDNTLAAGESFTVNTFATGVATNFVVGETYGLAKTGTLATATTFTVTATTATTVTGTVVTAVAISDAADGITIASAFSAGVAATDTLADTFQNLRLCKAGTNCANSSDMIGTSVNSLTDTAATTYSFTPTSSIKIAAGQQYVVDVVADAKTTGTTFSVNSDANGIVSFFSANATGDLTSSDASTTALTTLQNVFLGATGTFSTAIVDSGNSPTSAHVVMGTDDNTMGAWKLTAAPSEDITVTQVVVTDTCTAGACGSLSNLKLYKKLDSETTWTLVGQQAAFNAVTAGTATFQALNVTVLKNASVYFKVTASATVFGQAVAGSSHVLSLAAGSVTANGTQSGAVITSPATALSADTFKIFRTSLMASGGTGTGHSTSNPAPRSSSANILALNLSGSAAFSPSLRGSLQANDEADGGVAGNDWIALGTTPTFAFNAGVAPVDGTNSVALTEDGSAAVNDGIIFDFGTSAGLQNYSKVGFWFRTTVDVAAGDVQLCINDQADCATSVTQATSIGAVTAASAWNFIELDTAGLSSLDRYLGIRIAANAANHNASVFRLDNVRLYNDSIKVNLTGDLAAANAANALSVTLKDAGNTVKMQGYVNQLSSTTSAIATLITGADIGNAASAVSTDLTIGSSAATYNVSTNEVTLTKADTTATETLSATVNLGNASTVGDIRWYDGALTATSPATWVMGTTPISASYGF